MSKHIIHVNRQHIAANAKDSAEHPAMSKSKEIHLSNGSTLWMHNKKLHREDGPAIYNARTKVSKFFLHGERCSLQTWLHKASKYHLSSKQVTAMLLQEGIEDAR